MTATELKAHLSDGALQAFTALYHDPQAQTKRMIEAIDAFTSLYGDGREIALFSVPGRSEICGNHTDHNHGEVLAGAIDRDIIAVASPNEDAQIRFLSEGYAQDVVDLSRIDTPDRFRRGSSRALIAGIAAAFQQNGLRIGGYDAYSTSQVHKGSGISSSAAFEVMVGNILNHFYNDANVDAPTVAKCSQYAENVYFGKPCGLMDQMACAIGGFVYIDFADADAPRVLPIDFSLTEAGYALCIVNTGGNHANLTSDFAAVPAEMRAVAKACGQEVLRGLHEQQILEKIPVLRKSTGDRAILRALHFLRENRRVEAARDALIEKDSETFLTQIRESGRSSFCYLQNVYAAQNPSEQGLSLALCLTDAFLAQHPGACRVHGGGFAGTIQTFVRNEDADAYCAYMERAFGAGAAMKLRIRPVGATRLF